MHPELKEKLIKLLEKRDIQMNTIKNILNSINTVNRLMHRNEKYNSVNWLLISKPVVGTIRNSGYSLNYMYNLVQHIITILKSVNPDSDIRDIKGIKLYVNYWNELLDEKRKVDNSQKMTEKEELNWLTQSEIQDVANRLLEMHKPADFVIWSLYTLIPPRRAKDFCNIKLESEDAELDKNQNYIIRDIDGNFKKFLFHDFKNSKKKGTEEFSKEFLVDNFQYGYKMTRILDIQTRKIKNGDYLNKNLSANSFTKYFARLAEGTIGKACTINLCRHLYISQFLSESPFLKQKQIVAKYMSNSVQRQELYRKRPKHHIQKKI